MVDVTSAPVHDSLGRDIHCLHENAKEWKRGSMDHFKIAKGTVRFATVTHALEKILYGNCSKGAHFSDCPARTLFNVA